MPEAIQDFWARRLRRYVLHYFYALLASSWNAGIATLVASLGLAAAASIEPDHIRPLNWPQMFAAFRYGAVINALFHLRKNPLPEQLPDTLNTTPPRS